MTDDSGTGIVHCAPAFGEEDYRVCIENKILSKVVVMCETDGFSYLVLNIQKVQLALIFFYVKLSIALIYVSYALISYHFIPILQENLIVAVDDDGCFIGKITDFSGRYVKDADKDIIETVKVRLLCFPMDNDKATHLF